MKIGQFEIGGGKVFVVADSLRVVRPNGGLEPNRMWQVIGKKAKKNIKSGTPFILELVE